MSESSNRGPEQHDPTTLTGAQHSTGTTPLPKIGRYLLLRPLGRGGMGEVFEAEQTEPVHRKVALKLIKGGMDTQDVLARFDSERQALALMNHLNIARMLDGGATPEGRPYFVMEFIQGVPITDYCDANALTNPERLELFIQICAGVQHAHQKGIIHRDIKPSNVLVTVEDGKVIPKIIDFGLAKALGPADSDVTQYTHIGQVIGTPAYMSPEQVSGIDIDTRTDVYSLGVLLYQLLVGTVPFALKDTPEGGWDAFRKRICEQEPVRPSSRISSLGEDSEQHAKNRRIDPASWTKQLHGDLDWITLRALEKDRTRRYQSPSELAADITRHLKHEPVLASPPGRVYRAKKFVRRHRVGVSAAAVVALALIAGITGTTIGMIRATKAEKAAVEESENTRQLADFLTGLFRVSDPSEARGNSITAREILDRGAQKIEKELGNRPVLKAEMLRTIGGVYDSLGLYKQAQPLLEKSLAIAETAKAGTPLAKSNSQLQLGLLYSEQGKYGEALALAREALATRERALGPAHPEVARALLLEGIILRETGSFADSKRILERSLAIREKTLNQDHPELLDTLYHLGWLHYRMGSYQEAARCYERVLAAREKLGPNQPEVAGALGDLGFVRMQAGDYKGALNLFERALVISEKVLGPTHSRVANSLDSIGSALWYMARYHDARPYYERALAIREKTLGPEHIEVARSLNNLALLFRYIGEEEKSLPLYERAVIIKEKALGPEHPDLAVTLTNLAQLLSACGQHERARPLYTRALKIQEKVLGPESGEVAFVLLHFAFLHQMEGRYRQAITLLERALAIYEKRLGDQHPTVAATLQELASVYGEYGNYEEALALCERALKIQEKAPGPESLQPAPVLSQIAGLHRGNSKFNLAQAASARAAAILENAVAAAEKKNGPEDPKVAVPLVYLAELYAGGNNYEKARVLYERALAIREKARVPLMKNTLIGYANLHRDNRRYSAAQQVYERVLAIEEKKWGPKNFNIAEILVELARLEIARGRASQAEALFRRAASIVQKTQGESPIFFYDQACHNALLKNRDNAIYLLKQAVGRGYDSKYRITQNPDFASLRGDPEFKAILKQIKP